MVIYRQFIRYAAVGLASNTALFLVYLALTALGAGHKTAMTFSYSLGVGLSFVFNRSWTFGHRGRIKGSFSKYAAIYIFGYLLNYTGLYVWVDRLGYNHAIVQFVLVFSIAVMLFLLQKFFVFTPGAADGGEPD